MVDAENASPGSFNLMMEDLERRGIQTPIRRIYGKPPILQNSPWQTIILEQSFIPTYCLGLADMDLALDAMDILYTKDFLQGFVLFSSDADFTRLVQRIRENNLFVLGVGQRLKTNSAETLAKACHEYVYTEDLEMAEQNAIEAKEQLEIESKKEKAREKARLETEEKLRARERQECLAEKEEALRAYDGQWPGMQKAWQAVSRAFTASLNNTRWDMGASDSFELNSDTKKSEPIRALEEDKTTETSLEKVVQTLKSDLKTLSPNGDWVYLSLLTERSSCDVLQDTGYKRMAQFIRAQSDHFELKLEGTAYKVRRRE